MESNHSLYTVLQVKEEAEAASPVKLEEVKVESNVAEDNYLKNFIKLCNRIADRPGYNDKTNIGKDYHKKGD